MLIRQSSFELIRRGIELIPLNTGVDEETNVEHTEAYHLNRVFHAQGIPHEDQLINHPEDVQSQESRDRFGIGIDVILGN
jgi:hypothetical protein